MSAFARTLAVLLGLATVLHGSAQPLEGVMVETYQVRERADGQPPLTTYRVFLDLAPDTHLRRFPRLKFPTQAVPLPFVDIVGLFVAVYHQGFAVLFDVAERGKDHARYCT